MEARSLRERLSRFTYFLARPGPRPPIWIRPIQWALLGAWFFFFHWICRGEGLRSISYSFYNFHGVFTDEVIWRSAILPNLGLVSVALLALQIWLQVLWQRCRVAVEGAPGEWLWSGRKGPAAPESVARTPGGAWLLSKERWWYVAHGFIGEGGEDFVVATGAPSVPLGHWRRVASPLAALLVVLALCAWMLHRPLAMDRDLRNAAVRATWRGNQAEAEALVRQHPQFRPWVRYVESQRGCITAACLHRQIVTRLEGLSIGPTFASEENTLRRLLIINGWSRLALILFGTDNKAAVEVFIRLDRPREARRILERVRQGLAEGPGDQEVLLLLEEGRLEEAYDATTRFREPLGQRATVMKGVLAHMTGRCTEAGHLARILLSPQSIAQVRLDGEAPPTGLGGLLRVAREVRTHASYAEGLALLDQVPTAGAEWSKAERLSEEAGMPGLLDVDRVLLRRVARTGPWGASPPPHRRPPPALTHPEGPQP